MGVCPIEDDAWLEVDDRRGAELALKAQLLEEPATRARVVATLPGATVAHKGWNGLLAPLLDWPRERGRRLDHAASVARTDGPDDA